MKKPFWVDDMPKNWTAARLRFVATVSNSNVDKRSYENGRSVRLCNYTDVYYNDSITDDLELMVATATSQEVERFSLRRGDVLITKDSESWNDIAVPAHVATDLANVVCGYHLTLLRPRKEMDGRFLFRALQATGVREQLWLSATGVTRFGLGQQGIKNTTIPVPPVVVQKAIADFLDEKLSAIEKLIGKKRKFLELLAEKRAAIINQAVTKGLHRTAPMKASGVPWIGSVPEHWSVKRFKYVARLETGHTPSKSIPEYWVPSECIHHWISLNDTKALEDGDFIDDTKLKISEIGMRNSAAHLIESGAIVFNRDGARVGLASITTRPMAVSQHMIAWVCNPELLFNHYGLYVIYAMRDEIYRLCAGATIPTIGMDDVKGMTTPLPPIAEQVAIVEHVQSVLERQNRTETIVLQQLAKLHEYRQALITAAVTGQLDIPLEPA